jgi:hypothetical protein
MKQLNEMSSFYTKSYKASFQIFKVGNQNLLHSFVLGGNVLLLPACTFSAVFLPDPEHLKGTCPFFWQSSESFFPFLPAVFWLMPDHCLTTSHCQGELYSYKSVCSSLTNSDSLSTLIFLYWASHNLSPNLVKDPSSLHCTLQIIPSEYLIIPIFCTLSSSFYVINSFQ